MAFQLEVLVPQAHSSCSPWKCGHVVASAFPRADFEANLNQAIACGPSVLACNLLPLLFLSVTHAQEDFGGGLSLPKCKGVIKPCPWEC